MATITGAEDFSATPTGVTGARLDNHVNAATLSNVAQADMASSNGVIVRSASAPSDTDAGWWDTANNVFRVHDGSSWTPVATGALLTNKSGGQVIAGDVIVADSTTNNSFTTSTTSGDTGVLGVAAETIAADASGVILYGGIQSVLITGTVNRGEFLLHSTTAKKATSTTGKTSGSFGIALETGTDTTISALITGTVVSLSASTAESITAAWGYTAGMTFTNTTAPTTAANQIGLYCKDLSARAWPYFREESDGNEIALGRIVQVVNVMDGAVDTGTTALPHDDTAEPQITEGDEFMTLAITPTSTNNKLLIQVVCYVSHSTASMLMGAALFNTDSHATNALAVGSVRQTQSDQANAIVFNHYMTAPVATATTFRVRAGGTTGATTTFNGVSSGRIYAGVYASSITITEIAG